MDGNSGRASFNKSFEYPPLRKPRNIREDPSTPTTIRTSSVLSPDAPVFIPKQQKCSSNQTVIAGYSNHDGPAEGLTNDFSNMNVTSKNAPGWHNVTSNMASVQNRHYGNSSVQNRLNVSQNHSKPTGSFQDRSHTSSRQDRHPMSTHGHGQMNLSSRRELNYSNYGYGANGDMNEDAEQTEDEKFALEYIAHIVTYLNENPGSFDTIAARALNVFEGFTENEFVLSNSMETIFSKSIEEQNFRYMGARLYALLDSINSQDGSTFRNLLDLKLTYHREEILKYMQNEQYKVRGTALFLAELYMQLRNEGVRIPQIAQSIVYCMNQLLLKTTPENVKCTCLTLKLAGFDLEVEYPHEVSGIIEMLRSVKHVDNTTSRILENVLKLQKNNWGRSEIPVQQTFANESVERLTDAPVFYGPDGQVLTEEENNFLESNLPQESNTEEDIDSDEYELDPEMDAEMEKAYKEFLKTSPNNMC